MKNIAIFASGSGTNAENIAHYFRENEHVKINMILSNRADAGVLKRAERLSIPTLVFNREEFYGSDLVLDKLIEKNTDLVVLAGFLWLVPENILRHFHNHIINIHPALLPKYGGKGMYGEKVHRAVKDSGDNETGITIHLVNERYDEGKIIFQERCPVDDSDSPEDIAAKVHQLEYEHFPRVIEKILNGQY